MVGAAATAGKVLETARRVQTRARLTAQTFAVLWRGGLILLTAFALDMVVPWPPALRALFMTAWSGGISYGWLRSWQRERHARPREEQVAREIEALHPGLDNALIHAVQFGSQPTLTGTQADLIRRELARAEHEAAQLSSQSGVARAPVQRQRLGFFIVAGFMLLTALLTPRVYRFELPRFFAPWLDTPPFTLTDFEVSPAGAVVRSGETLVVSVRVGGWMPHRLELMTGSGKTLQPVALTAAGEGNYVAQLDRLTQDTAFFVAADTGRSPRYLVHVNTAPQLRTLTVTMHPPAYAKQPDKTVELNADGEISGLSNTDVDIRVESDRPLAEALLDINRQGMPPLHVRLAPQPGNPARAVGSFHIERDGDFRLHLTGTQAEGSLQSPDAAKGKINLVRDETAPGHDRHAGAECHREVGYDRAVESGGGRRHRPAAPGDASRRQQRRGADRDHRPAHTSPSICVRGRLRSEGDARQTGRRDRNTTPPPTTTTRRASTTPTRIGTGSGSSRRKTIARCSNSSAAPAG